MGDCGAYLACTADALGGKVTVDMGLPQRGPGIWAAEELPGGITVVPPCWIGRGPLLKREASWPHAVVGPGAFVGRRSLVQRSVLMENAKSRNAARCTAPSCAAVPRHQARSRSQRGRGAGSRGHGGGEQRPHGTGQGLAGEKGPEGGTAHGLSGQRRRTGRACLETAA